VPGIALTGPAVGFALSERQASALAALETFAGIRRPRRDFADREDFQAYWDQITRRGDASAKRRATETASERDARQKDRKERIATHYQDAEHLFAYACGYLARYQPSTEKLRRQLVQKSGSAEVSAVVMERIAERLNDDVRALELAEMLQRQGRHAQAISGKLRQRQFSAESIARALRTITPESGSVLEVAAVSRKVQQLQRKGLSQRAMRTKLMGSAADGAVVAAAIAERLGDQGDDQALAAAIAKLARKQLDSRALIQRLLGKGFRYADVKRVLAKQADDSAT
jgi:SOS response regulatory protein OraA/RecX